MLKFNQFKNEGVLESLSNATISLVEYGDMQMVKDLEKMGFLTDQMSISKDGKSLLYKVNANKVTFEIIEYLIKKAQKAKFAIAFKEASVWTYVMSL